MSDTSRPYMANSYLGAMRTPRTSKAGPHSEGKKPYHASDYLEMELYDITDVPPYVDSPLTEPPSTPPPGEPPTLEGEDPCSKGDRVYLVTASPSSISGCSGTASNSFTLYISPDFKCPALFQLTTLSSGPEVRFSDQPMIVDGISQRFPLYTKETTKDGEKVKSASGTITIDFLDCGNHSPWMMLAVAEECPCPGDTNLPIYSACTILLDQCVAHCVNCENPDCDDCPMAIGGGPAGGRASLSTSYNYTLTGAVGNVAWYVNNAGCTISNASSTGCTLNVGANACNYNNGAISLVAYDTRGDITCAAAKSAQAGTWVFIDTTDYSVGLPACGGDTQCWPGCTNTVCTNWGCTCEYTTGLYRYSYDLRAFWADKPYCPGAYCFEQLPTASDTVLSNIGCNVTDLRTACGSSEPRIHHINNYQWKCP